MNTEVKYGEHTITVTADLMFSISGPLYDEDEYRFFESLKEAKADIEKRTSADAKQKKAEMSIKLPVIASNGRRVNIKGIHSRLGSVLTDPPTDKELYAEADWVFAAVKERDKLADQLRAANARLAKIEIKLQRYYRGADPSSYLDAINALVDEYNKKAEIAKAETAKA